MEKIINRIKIEVSHFHALGTEGKSLLISMSLYNLADPLLWTFVSAYLWREYQSINIVAVYNFAAFIGLPIGYYCNGLLLRYFKHKNLYFMGTTLMGLIITVLLFTSNTPIWAIPFFGIAFGFGSGFYWGNKTFLSIYTTNSQNRIYFMSLDTISGNFSKIVVPLFIGWFIVFGSSINLYSEQTAYQIMAILLMILLFFAGITVKNLHVEQKPITSIRVKDPSRLWNTFRIFTVIGGMYGGIALFVSVLIVLRFVGNEESLGTIQSVAAAISSLAIYVVARKAQIKHRIYILAIGIFFAIAASLAFGVLYSTLGVVIYYVLSAPSFPLRWVSEGPLGYDVIDHEEEKHDNHHYSYIVDQEFFVNVGRNVAILFFVLFSILSPDIALRYILAVVALVQIVRIGIAQYIEKELHVSKIRLQEKMDKSPDYIK